MKKIFLFDLDGTLLPMENAQFEKVYFKGLCSALPEFPPEELVKIVWAGTKAMIQNDGSKTNRQTFAEVFDKLSHVSYTDNEERFLQYYRTGFQDCVKVCGDGEAGRKAVQTLKSKGYRVAAATNPLFPEIATHSRLRWIGMTPDQFELVTTFENSHYAKPNLEYYCEVCQKLGVKPEDCVMVGNNLDEDGCARKLGMEVLLITDCLINESGSPLEDFHACTMAEFLTWCESLEA